MVEVIHDFIPKGRRNRPGYRLVPEYITIHDTANPSPGADAIAHSRYLKSDAAASIPVSWHFTVDDHQIVQHLPLDENGWHAGDGNNGPGNRTSIGIEICENSDRNRAKAEENAAELLANLLQRLGLSLDRVVQHNHWNGKNCPRVLRSRPGGWEEFLEKVGKYMEREEFTPILGPPQATVEQAQKWARKRGAHQRFIDIAPVYWELGQKIGIRPEVAYTQAAKETAFGHYGGAVRPEQNNWAGIKTRDARGDRPEDHESFPTPEDGVCAHFNHLAAYVGVDPLGEPHGRYYLVKSLSWAGSIRYVEELGGKWAPNPDYGKSIVRDYFADLVRTMASEENNRIVKLEAENEQLKKQLEATIAENNQLRSALKQIVSIAEKTMGQ